ncbi:peptidase family M1-domain-containing protein [Emericellopsis atlantica]|uniref:Peptidase family M1-domain-containing protein n=1 Tax=Emericellopsis atlantica TaxID=2614577 RepID=A0A9P7ZGZ9_9HYPO|nr:peptidase family M1-domain-containing protein [Emericellopsis atlantica]KAG9251283.1 peptidase family M1-domain-containing protein [Emericellopsis atlantica]
MSWLTFFKRVSITSRQNATPLTHHNLLRRTFATVNMTAGTRDPSTLSNYGAWRTTHTTTSFTLDFQNKKLVGSVILSLQSQTERESKEVVLDSRFVHVDAVKIGDKPLQWDLKPFTEPLGAPLHVSVPEGVAKGETIDMVIDLETTSKCTALQWLTPAQTSNKKHPYMFSQCQAINARSIFPCQDTPDIKSTFTFNITSELPVVASGVPVGDHEATPGKSKVYTFEQKVPIPSYLFAVASGDIATAKIGPRSVVATGPNELEACKWELERDMEKFMEIADKLVFPYKWGEYNVLVLPPSFPYGGMENPIYTFATPTIISGDRQNVDVIAHELAHSWSGNLVSNSSWEHFWLNEGWTMYLERRIQAAIHGDAEFDFSAIIGWKALEDAIEQFKDIPEYTQLIIKHDNVDPEDIYSQVAYEKGFHMVYYLETVVGREAFDKFIPHYFTKWSGKSLDSWEFRDTYMDFFNNFGDEGIKKKIAEINWEDRLLSQGLPPKPQFDTSLADQCYSLAKKWETESFDPSPDDVKDFNANQKIVFLDALTQGKPLSAPRARQLGKVYELSASQNVELKSAFYQIAIKAGDDTSYAGAAELLGQVGRMKYVRPLFRGLNKVDRQLALDTFEKNREFYHPICKGMVAKDLGIKV